MHSLQNYRWLLCSSRTQLEVWLILTNELIKATRNSKKEIHVHLRQGYALPHSQLYWKKKWASWLARNGESKGQISSWRKYQCRSSIQRTTLGLFHDHSKFTLSCFSTTLWAQNCRVHIVSALWCMPLLCVRWPVVRTCRRWWFVLRQTEIRYVQHHILGQEGEPSKILQPNVRPPRSPKLRKHHNHTSSLRFPEQHWILTLSRALWCMPVPATGVLYHCLSSPHVHTSSHGWLSASEAQVPQFLVF